MEVSCVKDYRLLLLIFQIEMKLKMVVLDSPCGYVTRYDVMNDSLYPEDKCQLYRKLSVVVRVIVGARKLMEQTAFKLMNDTTEISVGKHQVEHMIPSFISNSSNKKRKQEL